MHKSKGLEIKHISDDFPIERLNHASWGTASVAAVTQYWSAKAAPTSRHFDARLLWSQAGLCVRFEANQREPLVLNEKPDLTKKTEGLWDRDVCEIFIAPDKTDRNRYFEFEIAPTGEWIDLAIEVTPARRKIDWDYASGMTSAVSIEKTRILMAIKIPWHALGKMPAAGDIWLGNLFRCIGKGSDRGYLAWQPTRTKEPNFHVPSRFGEFEFVT